MLSPHRNYKSVLFSIKNEINAALRNLYPDKQIWNITLQDQLRLVKLKVWSERYSLPVTYILLKLLEYHWSRLPKPQRDKAKASKGLGIRIATLIGSVSERHLKDCIFQDFPDGDHLVVFKEAERDRIVDLLEEELPSRPKGVLWHKTISNFIESYTRNLQSTQKTDSSYAKKLSKIPYRGNPWR